MGNTQSSPAELKLHQLVDKMQVISDEPTHHLMYLEDPMTKKEYLLRDIVVPNKEDFLATINRIEQKKLLLENAQHLLPVVEHSSSSSNHFCSSVSKISVLCEYPQRTLDDETCERHLQKRRYNEKELWTILASCILGMAHLQRNRISHEAVRSSQIFVENTGLIKIADPYISGTVSNWEVMANRGKIGHIYLSPELCAQLNNGSTDMNRLLSNIDIFKSDVFSLGMVMLETGLLEYQDDCYASNGNWLEWEKLTRNFQRFTCLYSEELCKVIGIMLDRDPSTRESWMQLEGYVRVMEPEEKNQSQKLKTAPAENPTPHVTPNLVGNSSMLQYTFGSQEFPRPQRQTLVATRALPQGPQQPTTQYTYVTQQKQQRRNVSLSPSKNYFKQPQQPPAQANANSNFTISSQGVIRPPTYCHSQSPSKGIFISKPRQQEAVNYASNPRVQQPLQRTPPVSIQTPNSSPTKNVSCYLENRFAQPEQRIQPKYEKAPSDRQRPSVEDRSKPLSGRRDLSPTAEVPQYVVELFKQGSRYEGYKCNNMRHGKGKFFYQDGGLYDGDWVCNKMTGFGRLYYQSGKLAYEGNWLQDTFNGSGVLHNENAAVLDHSFDYTNFELIDDCWTVYEGYFKEDLKHGRGKLYLSNDEYYDGNFCDDAVHGYGTFYRSNGSTVVGTWEYNRLVDF